MLVNIRSPLEATIALLVVLVGLLIGGMAALLTRPATPPQRVVVVTGSASRGSARVAATQPPTHALLRAQAPTHPPTPQPTVVPTAAPAPSAAATEHAVEPALPGPSLGTRSGVWRIEEANVQVGTILWSGAASPAAPRDAIALDVHKESVGGHAISACERQTNLHVVISAAAAAQTVPYREVNCSGEASSGEMRVSSFSPSGASFSGSFWSGGSKLGDFNAVRTEGR